MRYEELVERSQQRTEIMYHGTSSNLVRSILKNGLLATPPKKTYDVDTYGASTASMGGVYVTPEKSYALEIAKESVETHGGRPALVTIQYVRGSADLDEDDIVAAISQAASNVVRELSQKAPDLDSATRYDSLSYPHEGWAVDQMIKNKQAYAAEIANEAVQILSKKAKPRKTALGLIQEMAFDLLRIAGADDSIRDRWNTIRYGAYDVMRQEMEQPLAALMRQISPDLPGNDKPGPRRIDRDVKFSGKTRIIKIEVGDQVIYPKGAA